MTIENMKILININHNLIQDDSNNPLIDNELYSVIIMYTYKLQDSNNNLVL